MIKSLRRRDSVANYGIYEPWLFVLPTTTTSSTPTNQNDAAWKKHPPRHEAPPSTTGVATNMTEAAMTAKRKTMASFGEKCGHRLHVAPLLLHAPTRTLPAVQVDAAPLVPAASTHIALATATICGTHPSRISLRRSDDHVNHKLSFV